MITHAMEKEAERAAWDIWISVYPGFTKDTFVPFSEFKAAQLKVRPRATTKTWDEITEEMDAVVQQYEAKKRGEPK
jgi:hypothetical protein